MKTTLTLALLSALALPALAASTTVEFVPANGADTVVAVFSDDGTVSFNGGPAVAYTMDQDTRTICSVMGEAKTAPPSKPGAKRSATPPLHHLAGLLRHRQRHRENRVVFPGLWQGAAQAGAFSMPAATVPASREYPPPPCPCPARR